jgi:acetylglutamate kinase
VKRRDALSAEKNPDVLIKIGGELAGDASALSALAGDIVSLGRARSFVLVHGGGAEVSELMNRLGTQPVFRDGVRITAPEEMDQVDQVLSGRINKRLVRSFQEGGTNAVGISGSDGRLLIGRPIAPDCRTGEIVEVDVSLIRLLLEGGFFPIVSPTSMDREGVGLNINADTAAFALACALKASALIFFSDIPGVLKRGKVIPSMDPLQAEREIAQGTISGGMIPKLRASLEALENGVRTILIGEYRGSGDLQALLNGENGTRIVRNSSNQGGEA